MPEQRPNSEAIGLDLQRDTWNAWVKKNVRGDYPDNVRRGRTVLQLLKSLDLRNPGIIEIGCANGWLSAELALLGTVTGVDLADEAIGEAEARYPNIAFICGDFLTLSLDMEHFDVAVSVDVISYFHDQRLFVDRVAAILKPHGHLILICPNKFVWDRTDFVRQLQGKVPVKWLYRRELKNLLRHSFTVLRSETIIPGGKRGILRLVNSGKVNSAIEKIFDGDNILKFKEKIGLGKSLVMLAQRRE